jgi:hypothetical protein
MATSLDATQIAVIHPVGAVNPMDCSVGRADNNNTERSA